LKSGEIREGRRQVAQMSGRNVCVSGEPHRRYRLHGILFIPEDAEVTILSDFESGNILFYLCWSSNAAE
jgi:hypothetical protein